MTTRSSERILLRTPRLTMREFTASDFDPRILKYINGGKSMSRTEVEATVRRVTGYYALYPGLGVWRASRRDNEDFVGWYCLKYCPPTADVEVGYRLLFDAWGMGLATEGARALVAYGFGQLGLLRIIGVTHPGNRASQHVLQKSGLRDAGWGRYYNRRLRLFIAESPDAPGR
jgi:RimJ/RimL family protein N-acetyltransferase